MRRTNLIALTMPALLALTTHAFSGERMRVAGEVTTIDLAAHVITVMTKEKPVTFSFAPKGNIYSSESCELDELDEGAQVVVYGKMNADKGAFETAHVEQLGTPHKEVRDDDMRLIGRLTRDGEAVKVKVKDETVSIVLSGKPRILKRVRHKPDVVQVGDYVSTMVSKRGATWYAGGFYLRPKKK